MSKPCSRIAQHAECLGIRGVVPWLQLQRLLKLLPRLRMLLFNGVKDSEASRCCTVYHPTHPHLSSTIHIACRTILALTSLYFNNQWFSSTGDVLRLFACFPHLSFARLRDCTIHTASTAAPPMQVTRLERIKFERVDGISPPKAIPSLARWWQWPHATSDPASKPYSGLHHEDAQCVVAVVASIISGPFEWRR